MEFLRIVVATLFFIAGTFLVVGTLITGVNWQDLLAALLFYLFAYLVWPSKKRGSRETENPMLDMLEYVVEFPIEVIIWFFRLLGRLLSGLFGNKSDGIDIDF